MKIKNYLLAGIVAIGLISCSDDKDVTGGENPNTSLTYVNVSINLPSKSQLRADPEDYNQDGTYTGNDSIKTLDIYLVDNEGVTEAKRFQGNELTYQNTEVRPTEPFKTTAGTKTVYIIINSPAAIRAAAPADDELLPIANLAQVQNGKDIIVMTGKSSQTVIADGVTEAEAAAGANKVAADVTRIASRVIVTTTAPTNVTNSDNVVIGTVSDVEYSVAQGTNRVYFTAQTDYKSYGYDYIPTTTANYDAQAPTYYDYSDLANPVAVPVNPATAGDYKSLPGKFLFENTHVSGADASTSKYKKGNTAYVLVGTTFTPAIIQNNATLSDGTFYFGTTDGLFYATPEEADAGVTGQKVLTYTNGKMYYYAWLNPDNIASPINSPVIRNNIYHINITGFKTLGSNWNPLEPGIDNPNPGIDPPVDPTDPLTPTETYMSVDITVLDWTVHSYDVDFD